MEEDGKEINWIRKVKRKSKSIQWKEAKVLWKELLNQKKLKSNGKIGGKRE
jgi:hypothetical protein